MAGIVMDWFFPWTLWLLFNLAESTLMAKFWPLGMIHFLWVHISRFKFLNLVKILKFGQNSDFFCLQILYLKIFHLKILNWICRQCVDCQVRNIDSDCLLLEKSTVTLASRLSTFWRPRTSTRDLTARCPQAQERPNCMVCTSTRTSKRLCTQAQETPNCTVCTRTRET